jgi:hypothetical protein
MQELLPSDAHVDEEETYHLIVGPRLEERLHALARGAPNAASWEPARKDRDAGETCPTCLRDLEALGLAAGVSLHCAHGDTPGHGHAASA